MLDYIGDTLTLKESQGKTLRQRTALFNAKYAPVKISITTFRNAYKKLGIKKKKIRETKVVPEKSL